MEKDKNIKTMCRLWFNFMRLNPGYFDCCRHSGKGRYGKRYAFVYETLGDVFNRPFAKWWAANRDRFVFKKSNTFTIAENYKDWEDDPRRWIIVVNLDETQKDLLQKFESLLQRKHRGKPGRPRQDNHPVDFPLMTAPTAAVIRNLKNTLKVYKIKTSGKRITHWKIAYKHRELFKKPTDSANELNKVDVHRSVTSAISRHMRRARNILENAALGTFPNPNKPRRHIPKWFKNLNLAAD